MSERPETFNGVDEEPEATLVTPRFDAAEAQRAHPVVPLAEARTPDPYANIHTSRPNTRARRGMRRTWPPALLFVMLLAAAALGGVVATKVLRRTPSNPAAVQTTPESAPIQTAEEPTQPETLAAAEAPREEATSKPPVRNARASRARDVAAPSPPLAERDEERNYDVDEDRRGKSRERRHGCDEDEGERELHKILKRAKGKAPRLVDVLTNP